MKLYHCDVEDSKSSKLISNNIDGRIQIIFERPGEIQVLLQKVVYAAEVAELCRIEARAWRLN